MKAHLTEARTSLLLYHCDGTELVPLASNLDITIGRDAPCDVQVRDRSLSRHHARIATSDNGIWLEDLGSTNGSFVNDERISTRTELRFGDQIALGSVAVVLQAHGGGEGTFELESHDRFSVRVEDEIERSRVFGRRCALLMVQGVRTRANRWAARVLSHVRSVDRAALWAPDCIEILLPEADRRFVDGVVSAILADKGEKVRCGVAVFPDDGSAVAALLDHCHAATLGEGTATPAVEQEPGAVVLGESMRELMGEVDRVAASNLPVLLLGETGVGKEVVSGAIHDASGRTGRLIPVNCGAIPPNLLESILFGHMRGAFTGANEQRKGVFEDAHGGSVFLDEIGELPAEAQTALLRALDTGRITRVGATTEVEVDVRIIAATHRDLEEMVSAGGFRQDLFYRLNAVTMTIPPLRERVDEVGPLADRFMAVAAREGDRPMPALSPQALVLLRGYAWPGNVRELKNAIERAVVICRDGEITPDDLPERVRRTRKTVTVDALPETGFKEQVEQLETRLILEALRACDGNQSRAAERLRMPRRTLVNKIKALGIRKLGYDVAER
jgi:DNA-binding NtrC family response regulator